jgi:hypothetical protein
VDASNATLGLSSCTLKCKEGHRRTRSADGAIKIDRVSVHVLRSDEGEVNAALSRELTRGAEQPPSHAYSLVLLAYRHIVDKEFGIFSMGPWQRMGGDATG